MKKFLICICTLFCTAIIAISIYSMSNTAPNPAKAPTETSYILREHKGKLAVFVPREEEPLAVYEVYVHLLPENDVELLRKGITVDSDYALQKRLEDFGL